MADSTSLHVCLSVCLALPLSIVPTLSPTPTTSPTYPPLAKPTSKTNTSRKLSVKPHGNHPARALASLPLPKPSTRAVCVWSSWEQLLLQFLTQWKPVSSAFPPLHQSFSRAPKWDLRSKCTALGEMETLTYLSDCQAEGTSKTLFHNIIHLFNTSSPL